MRLMLLLAALGCGSDPDAPDVDADGDGFTADVDCDDHDARVFPGAIERCNGRDDDCDGMVDEDPLDPLPHWPDLDGDGFGDGDAEPVYACDPPEDHVRFPLGDCDDDDPDIHPGVPLDVCDGIDADCDGLVDEDPDLVRYVDEDGDGFGAHAVATCDVELGVAVPGDCDDSDAGVHPGAVEVCNGVDDDCDGVVDEDALDAAIWYPDADGDGFGADLPHHGCRPGPDWVLTPGDCDDWDPFTHPGARQLCDGRDNTCEGAPEPPDSWLDPTAAHRIWLQIADGAPGLALAELDVGDLDPTSLRLALQTCDGGGVTELPAQWLDGVDARLSDVISGPDERRGAVAFVIPEAGPVADALAADDPVSLALYLGGSAPPTPGGPDVTADLLANAHLTASLLEGLLTVQPTGGPIVLAQAAPAVSTPEGWLGAEVVEQEVVVDGPVLGGVRVIARHDEAFEARTTWWIARDRPEVFGRMDLTALSDLDWSHPGGEPVLPWSFGWPGLVDPAVYVGDGAYVDGGAWGVSWRALSSHVHATSSCDADACGWIARDLPTTGTDGVFPEGSLLIDGALLILRPHGGAIPEIGSPSGPAVVEAGDVEAF